MTKNSGKAKHIESVLNENRSFPPSAEFVAKARIRPKDLAQLHRHAQEDYIGFWAELARRSLKWHRPFSVTLDDSKAPNYRWFTDGELNVSYNCLDVHLAERGHKTRDHFRGRARRCPPPELSRTARRGVPLRQCAARRLGVRRGDRVVIYMPHGARGGRSRCRPARASARSTRWCSAGFSALSLRDRIEDAGAKLVITADGGWRGGSIVALKAAVDQALAEGCPTIESVVVLRRTGARRADGARARSLVARAGRRPVASSASRNGWMPSIRCFCSTPPARPASPRASSTRARGYLLNAKLTCEWVFDLRDDDVFWCTADVGWVTGHSYVAYGPLGARARPSSCTKARRPFPDGGRFWKICQTHGVTVFYTAPTAIRALMKLGDEIPGKYDLSRLRLLGSVGEPINPEAWMWYQRVIGRGRCPIVDTWWQTETGAIMISPLPGVTATKPGSCTQAAAWNLRRHRRRSRASRSSAPNAGGYLVIRKPWPSLRAPSGGDNERYLSTYWEKFQNRFYVAGDGAHRDADGYFWIIGRIDDVLNVAGHRLGTMEIESALVAHPQVAEAAVVGRPHEIKGEAVFAYVVCRGARPGADAPALTEELRRWVARAAQPDRQAR